MSYFRPQAGPFFVLPLVTWNVFQASTGFALLKEVFPRWVAWLGIASGITALLSLLAGVVPALGLLTPAAAATFAIWLAGIALSLFRLSRAGS